MMVAGLTVGAKGEHGCEGRVQGQSCLTVHLSPLSSFCLSIFPSLPCLLNVPLSPSQNIKAEKKLQG